MSESAYKSFEISKKNQLKPIANLKFSLDDLNKPRQDFKNTYVANGVIDIYRKKFILKNKKLFFIEIMISLYLYNLMCLTDFPSHELRYQLSLALIGILSFTILINLGLYAKVTFLKLKKIILSRCQRKVAMKYQIKEASNALSLQE